MGGAEKGSEGANTPTKMSFHVGQKVVCIKRGPWTSGYIQTTIGPKYGDVVEVARAFNDGYLALVEWERHPIQNLWSCDRFRPLDELEQQLERIESEPVEEPEYA